MRNLIGLFSRLLSYIFFIPALSSWQLGNV